MPRKAICNATVIDVENRTALAGQTVLIRDKMIEALLPAGAALPQDCAVIDAGGKYLIPGLFDMHAHFFTCNNQGYEQVTRPAARIYLANGVTTAVSKGEIEPEEIFAFRDAVENGEEAGPRILTSGNWLNRAPFPIDILHNAVDEADLRRGYEKVRDRADFIKAYATLPPQWTALVIQWAHEDGLTVYGHLGATTTTQAARAGIDGIEHGILSMTELTRDGGDHLSIDPADLDPAGKGKELLELLHSQNVACIPTVDVLKAMCKPNRRDWFDAKGVWDFYREEDREWHREQAAGKPHPNAQKAAAVFEAQNAFMGELHRRGGKIFVGTDPSVPYVFGGMNYPEEARLVQALGLSEMEVLRAATILSARQMGVDGITGSIEPGKEADLVLLDANPLEDILNLGRVFLTIKGGQEYDPAALLDSAKGTLPICTQHKVSKPI